MKVTAIFLNITQNHLMILQPLSYSQMSLMSLLFLFDFKTHTKPCCYGNSVQAT